MKAAIGLLLLFAGFGMGYLILTGKLGNSTSSSPGSGTPGTGTSTPVTSTPTPTALTTLNMPKPGAIGGSFIATSGQGGGLINPPVRQAYFPGSQLYF